MIVDSQKTFLFGELIKSRSFCGTKQHWRDVVSNDIKTLDIPAKELMVCFDNEQTIMV